jgi:hypothetical protein
MIIIHINLVPIIFNYSYHPKEVGQGQKVAYLYKLPGLNIGFFEVFQQI